MIAAADLATPAGYQCEDEITRILDRRQRLRPGPPYAPVSIAQLVDGTTSLIASQSDQSFRIENARWMTGGASKLQIAFTCTFADGSGGEMVLRMEPAESLVETSRLREFEIIDRLKGILPVPGALFLDAHGDHLPHPAAIYALVQGVTKPKDAVERVTGMGLNFGPALRPVLTEQFIGHLATLHNLDPSSLNLESFQIPSSAAEAAEWQISWWERVWDEDHVLEVPLIRVATSWLRENIPPLDRASVVHGDFRNGNFLFDEADGRITALLDWEMAHIGDRHEDLAYLLQPAYGHFAEDGRTYLVCGLVSRDAFIRRYEEASGLSVDPATLKYYEVLNLLKCAAIVRATSPRVVMGGKSHQDVIVAWAGSISYLLMEELRRTLEEVV